MRASILLPLLLLVCALPAVVRAVETEEPYIPATCEYPLHLYNGVANSTREEAIVCVMRALDANGDGRISGEEYARYLETIVWIKRKVCPSWTWILSRCDCNGDRLLAPEELRHASKTCLESPFWVNRVRGQTC